MRINAFQRAIGAMLVACLAGCASVKDSLGTFDPHKVTMPELSSCRVPEPSLGQAQEDFDRALGYCRQMFNYYAGSSRAAAQRRFYIATVGTLAAGVIAPALAAGAHARSVIAAWSGVGGVTNAMQADLNDGALSEASALAEQRQVAASVASVVTQFQRETKGRGRCDAAVSLLARCVAADAIGAAPTAEIKALTIQPSATVDLTVEAGKLSDGTPVSFINSGTQPVAITKIEADNKTAVSVEGVDTCTSRPILVGSACTILIRVNTSEDLTATVAVTSDVKDGALKVAVKATLKK